ncbi:MAG: hypothetical protein WBZ45_00635 [Acidimicrobiia bacterium]
MKLTRRELMRRLGGSAVVLALVGGTKLILIAEDRRQAPGGAPDDKSAGSPIGADTTTTPPSTVLESTVATTTSEVTEVTTLLIGSIGATTIPRGTSASITGDLDLQGDLVVEGVLTGVDTFTLKGNGHQIEVRNGGRVDLRGVPKTGWTRDVAPSGWAPGDRVATAPNGKGLFGIDDFTIETWHRAAVGNVQLVGGRNIGAEQFNLDRSIVIDDVSRIMFHDGAGQQVLKHLAVRNAGQVGELGFYPIHFHLNGDDSRGSLVEGVVVEGGRNHAFVPHGSHGITFIDCVAFDTTGEAFWYDPPPEARSEVNNSNDTMWNHCLAAYVSPSDDRGYRLAAFTLGAGSGNSCIDCTAVGVQGQKDSSGFMWPEAANDNPGGTVWTFEGCVSHNNRAQGIFTWQNDGGLHPIEDFVAYRNGDTGIDHGAYVNRYHYSDLTLSENGSYSIQSHALGRGDPIVFENVMASEPLLISKHVLEGSPVIYRNLSVPGVILDEETDDGNIKSTQIFEDCGLTPSDFDLRTVAKGTVIEIRQGGLPAFRWNGTWE